MTYKLNINIAQVHFLIWSNGTFIECPWTLAGDCMGSRQRPVLPSVASSAHGLVTYLSTQRLATLGTPRCWVPVGSRVFPELVRAEKQRVVLDLLRFMWKIRRDITPNDMKGYRKYQRTYWPTLTRENYMDYDTFRDHNKTALVRWQRVSVTRLWCTCATLCEYIRM